MTGTIIGVIITISIYLGVHILISISKTPLKQNKNSYLDNVCNSIVHTKKWQDTTMPKDKFNDSQNFPDWLVDKNNHS